VAVQKYNRTRSYPEPVIPIKYPEISVSTRYRQRPVSVRHCGNPESGTVAKPSLTRDGNTLDRRRVADRRIGLVANFAQISRG
jgi:hypothetical protein